MKFNVATVSQEGFISAFVLVFENGIVLRSASPLWIGDELAGKLEAAFDQVVDAAKNGTLQFDQSLEHQTPIWDK